MENAIEVNELVKSNGEFQLGKISLKIPSGIIVGLIGENGAGKTTFIKSLLGIVKPDCGKIEIFGKDFNENAENIKEEIGVVLDETFFPEILNARNIDSIMRGIFKKWDSKLFYKYLEEFNLPRDKKLKELSKGMQKKLEIATALSHKPKLLILDEPTSGLDPVVRSEILDLFLKFIKDDEHTILLSTHITTDLEHVADKIIFLDKGKKILDETRDDIMDKYAVLKCNIDYFNEIDKKDVIRYKKNKYDYEILVEDREKIRGKYKGCIIDNITLENLMLLMIKGEK